MSSCFGSRKKSRRQGDREPLLPQYDDDTSLQRVAHQKLHTYQMLRALSKGFMPSTEQTIVNLRTLLASDVLNPDTPGLSTSGRKLVYYSKTWLQQFIELLRNKNDGDQIQDFIWFLVHARIQIDTDDLIQTATSSRAKADASAAYESIRTVGSLLLTNSDFRIFLSDLNTIGRQVFSDTAQTISNVAEDAAKQIEPSAEERDAVREPGNDDGPAPTSEELGAEAAEIADVVANGVKKTGQEAGASLKEQFSGDEGETLKNRLKVAVTKLRKRNDYTDSVSTIGVLIKRYAKVYSRAIDETISTVQDDVDTNVELDRAIKNGWSLMSSFGDKQAWKELEKRFNKVMEHAQKDPEFESMMDDVAASIQQMLTDPDFFDSESSKISELGEKTKEASSKVSNKVSEFGEQSRDAGSDVSKKGSELGEEAKKAGKDVSKKASELGSKAQDAGKDVSKRASELGDKSKEAGNDVSKKASELGDKSKDAGKDVSKKASELGAQSKEAGKDAADKVSDAKDKAKEAGNEASKKAPGLKDKAKEVGDEASKQAPGLKDKAKEVGNEVSKQAPGLKEKAKEVGQEASDKAPGLIEKAKEVGKEASDKAPGLLEKTKEVGNEVSKKASELGEKSKEVGAEASTQISDLKEPTKEAGAEASNKVSELTEKVKETVNDSTLRKDIDALLIQARKTFDSVIHDQDVSKLLQTTLRIWSLLSPSNQIANPELLRDTYTIFIPLFIQAIQYLPIPRLEISAPEIDLLLENLILEPGRTINNTSFLPFRLKIETYNDLSIHKRRFRTISTVKSLCTIKIQGLSIRADEVGFWLRAHKGLLRLADEGIASFELDDRGIDIELDVEIGKERLEKILTLKATRVKIHHLSYTLRKSKFSCLAWLLKPLLRPILRKVIERQLSTAISDFFHAANRELVFARERLRATRISDPKDIKTFIKAVLTRLTPDEDPDLYANIGVRGGAERRGNVFAGVYAPGSVVRTWDEEGREAEERVWENAEGRRSWRNEIFDVQARNLGQ